MSTSQEAPDLIQYACERCKTRFVLPPSSRRLSIGGKTQAFATGLGRTLRYHEGLGASYEAAQRSLLAKMDDRAYQSFVQSFRFCHECRQFVCNECWSDSRRSCLTCVAKAMTGTARPRPPFAPAGPEIPRPVVPAGPGRVRRIRRDLALVALALGLILVALEVGVLFANVGGPGATPPTIVATPPATPTASPSPTATPTASPSPTATPTASPSPTASPTASPTPTSTPTLPPVTPRPPTPRPPTPRPPTPPPVTPPPVTPPPTLPTPVIACSSNGTQWSCSWTNHGVMPLAKPTWFENGVSIGEQFSPLSKPSGTKVSAYLVVSEAGFQDASSLIHSYTFP